MHKVGARKKWAKKVLIRECYWPVDQIITRLSQIFSVRLDEFSHLHIYRLRNFVFGDIKKIHCSLASMKILLVECRSCGLDITQPVVRKATHQSKLERMHRKSANDAIQNYE